MDGLQSFKVVTRVTETQCTFIEHANEWKITMFHTTQEKVKLEITLPGNYARTAVFQFIDKIDQAL